MKNFRISFGLASCKNRINDKNDIVRKISERILVEISKLEMLSFDQLSSFNEEEPINANIDGKNVCITTFSEKINETSYLVVVQAYYNTLRFPNYISFNGVAKVFADGFTVKADGTKEEASIDLLLQYW